MAPFNMSTGLRKMLRTDKVRPGSSLNSEIKRIKKAETKQAGGYSHLTNKDKKRVRKTGKTLYRVETGKMAGRRTLKKAITELKKVDHLKSAYKRSMGKSLLGMKAATKANASDDSSEPAATPADRKKQREEDRKKTKRNLARARESRRETEMEKQGVTKSLGRKDLERAAVSVSEIQRRKRAGLSEKPQKKEPVFDVPID